MIYLDGQARWLDEALEHRKEECEDIKLIGFSEDFTEDFWYSKK
jgi:hypothetical protein